LKPILADGKISCRQINNEMLIPVLSLLVLLSSRGQGHPQGNSEPYFGPSKKLDFELEMVSI